MTKFHRYERKLDHDNVRRHFDKILQAPETTPEVYEIVANFMNRCLEGEFYLDSPCICIDSKINAIYDTLEQTIDLIDHQHKGIRKELIRITKKETPLAKLILLSATKAVDYYPKIGMKKWEQCYVLDDIDELK